MAVAPLTVRREGGRPRKTLQDLPTGWQKTVLDLMAEGAGVIEARTAIGMSRGLHYEWMESKDFKEYKEVFDEGADLSQCWWEQMGRKNLGNERFNHVLWYMNMKNRFRKRPDAPKGDQSYWADKTETEVSDPGRDALVDKAIKQSIKLGGLKIEF